MSEGKVRVIIKRPDEEFGHVTNISSSLKNLQNIVGGYVEAHTLGIYDWGTIFILCNEEGRLRRLPYNCYLPAYGIDFVGEIIVGAGDEEGEMIDLPISLNLWKNILLGKEEF